MTNEQRADAIVARIYAAEPWPGPVNRHTVRDAVLEGMRAAALRAAPTPAPPADLVALVAKWREEAAAYPVASSTGAMWTSVAVNACANELAAALASPVGQTKETR